LLRISSGVEETTSTYLGTNLPPSMLDELRLDLVGQDFADARVLSMSASQESAASSVSRLASVFHLGLDFGSVRIVELLERRMNSPLAGGDAEVRCEEVALGC
jgi:hypothetical protein